MIVTVYSHVSLAWVSYTFIQVRQIRNRLSSSDWLFLNACLGIVNDDASAVRAHLRQEGDRARQLTKEECLVLGQPSTFSVGGTLAHLAIRCVCVAIM